MVCHLPGFLFDAVSVCCCDDSCDRVMRGVRNGVLPLENRPRCCHLGIVERAGWNLVVHLAVVWRSTIGWDVRASGGMSWRWAAEFVVIGSVVRDGSCGNVGVGVMRVVKSVVTIWWFLCGCGSGCVVRWRRRPERIPGRRLGLA